MRTSPKTVIRQLKWSAIALVEGRKIARKLAKENHTKVTYELPDRCDLSEGGTLIFSWDDDRYAPVTITTYEGQIGY